MTGWDFTGLSNRMSTRRLAWRFEEIVSSHAQDSPDLLDMETGGGEWLAALAHRPPRTAATEAWPPNVDVVAARLRPLGITVVQHEAVPDNVDQRRNEERGRLLFPSESFTLVSEPRRVCCKRGGSHPDARRNLLTEQVGGNYDDFYEALALARPHKAARPWDLRLASEHLEAAGLRIVDSGEGEEETAFADVGAFAWYLKAIPWVVDGFAIETHRSELAQLHERIRATGPVTVRQPAFWLKAILT